MIIAVNDDFRLGRASNAHQFPESQPVSDEQRMRELKKSGFPGALRVRCDMETGKTTLEFESMYSNRWNPL